jgi:hypothetical protein
MSQLSERQARQAPVEAADPSHRYSRYAWALIAVGAILRTTSFFYSANAGETSGLAALAILVFYSMHIGYSTTSSAEISYLFFLLVALALFFGYFRDDSRPRLQLALAGPQPFGGRERSSGSLGDFLWVGNHSCHS